MSTSTVQTLVTKEKSTKRSREEESPSMTEISSEGFKIMYRKKAKLDSKLSLSKDSEQENIITTKEPLVSTLVGDQTTLSPTTSTTSQYHQQVMLTSTSTIGEVEKSIFDIFEEIKVRNEAFKSTHIINSGSRLLSAFDSEKGKMQMAFLQAQIP